jgi:hypothetical protein
MKAQKSKRKSKPRQGAPQQERERSPIGDQTAEVREDERRDRLDDEDVEERKIGRPVRLEH